MLFDPIDDEEAVKIQGNIKGDGITNAITSFTGIEEGDQLFQLIMKHYDEMK